MKVVKQGLTLLILMLGVESSGQDFSIKLKGKVQDRCTEQGIADAQVFLIDKEGKVYSKASTTKDGKYAIGLAEGISYYKMRVEATGYNEAETKVHPYISKKLRVDFKLDRQEKVKQIDLPTIYFDFNSSYFNVEAKVRLKEIGIYLRVNPELRVRVSAYTDSRGSFEYNQWLSDRRANRVIEWLKTREGIASDRLEFFSYGKRRSTKESIGERFSQKEKYRNDRRCMLEVIVEKCKEVQK